MPPSLGDGLARATSRLRVDGWTTSFRWSADDEEERVFQVQVTRCDELTLIAIFDDITEQVRLEEIQDRARLYLESVLNHLNLGVFVLDSRYRITFLNKEQLAILDRLNLPASLFDIIGSQLTDIYPVVPAEEWTTAFQRVREGETVTWTRLPYPSDRPSHHFLVTMLPLTQQDRTPGAVCVSEDVTRLVRLEDELVEKERQALVGQVAVALNHEINNPLTTVLGIAETLLEAELPRESRTLLELLQATAARIASVTRKLQEVETIHLTEYIKGGPMMLDLQLDRPDAGRLVLSPPSDDQPVSSS